MHRFWLAAGALNMLVALIIAASLGHNQGGEFVPIIRNTFDTARDMHFVHALALLAVGILTVQDGRSRLLDLAGGAFLLGIACFCGPIYVLYGLDFSDLKFLIPVGGTTLIIGWGLFTAAALQLKGTPLPKP